MSPTTNEIVQAIRDPALLEQVKQVEIDQLRKLKTGGEGRQTTEPTNLNDFLMDLHGGGMAKELNQFFVRMTDAQGSLQKLAKRLRGPLKEQANKGIEMFSPEVVARTDSGIIIKLTAQRGKLETSSNFHPKEGFAAGNALTPIGKNERVMWSLAVQKSEMMTLDGVKEKVLAGITGYKENALAGLMLVSEALEGRICPPQKK
ncbi:MAG: hypothetical protein V1875_06195 [Candidatus Altiarchaeota archaeon]